MRKLPILLASTVLSLSLAGCGGNATGAAHSEGDANQAAIVSSQLSTDSTEGCYYAGRYIVGADIPSGGYVLTTEQSYLEKDNSFDNLSWVVVHTDASDDDYLVQESFWGSYHISVTDGQVLEVKRATFVPA